MKQALVLLTRMGVQRQYSGTLGRIDNCQVDVRAHLVGEQGSACIGMGLYLPESCASDFARRKKAGVPPELEFREKWRAALAQLDSRAAGIGKHEVLADAGYGVAVLAIFGRVGCNTAHRHGTGAPPGPCVWLLVEWPAGEKAPRKYWLSSLPEGISLHTLVRLAKLR